MHIFDVTFTSMFAAVLFLTGCRTEERLAPQSPKVWRSQNFNVSATLTEGWLQTHINTPGDTYDRPNQLLASFLNKSGPYGYVITIGEDAPLEQLSAEDYLTALRNQNVGPQLHELLDEGEIDYHGHRFHRFRLKRTGKNGAMLTYLHAHRNGRHAITVQWVFPLSTAAHDEVPAPIATFDQNVTLPIENLSR